LGGAKEKGKRKQERRNLLEAVNGLCLVLRGALFIIILILVVVSVSGREPKVSPDGRIRILFLGASWGVSTPLQEFIKDPMMRVTPVPASGTHLGGFTAEVIKSKYLRVYMPRTISALTLGYDVVIHANTRAPYFTGQQLEWFRRGVEEGGQGLLMIGGRDTQLGEWAGTPLEDALPSTFLGIQTYEGRPFQAIPTDPSHEFITALPFKDMPPYIGMDIVAPRQDSTIILTSNTPHRYPVLIFHEYGKGATMFHTPDWAPAWGGAIYCCWEYYGDFVLNMMYMCAGLGVPQDPGLMHIIREYFGDYEIKKGLIASIAEFIDSMGANTAPLYGRMSEVDAVRDLASTLYLQQNYESVLSTMKQALQELNDVEKLALELKDRAMTWIYITEVTALTGTSLAAGTVIWLLMIRRKLYKEVAVTRLRGRA